MVFLLMGWFIDIFGGVSLYICVILFLFGRDCVFGRVCLLVYICVDFVVYCQLWLERLQSYVNNLFLVSFVGMGSQTVSFKGKKNVVVHLRPEVNSLDEVVVTGYCN